MSSPTYQNGGGARVGIVRAPAADLPSTLAAMGQRWIESRAIEPSRPVDALMGFGSSTDIVAMRQAAAAAVTDAVTARIRWWLGERKAGSAFEDLCSLHSELCAWAARNGVPAISQKRLSQRLKTLGFEQRYHSRTRRSQFWLAASSKRSGGEC